MDKRIQEYGGNAFKPAHMAKARLEKEGRLPLSLRCSDRTAEVLSLSLCFATIVNLSIKLSKIGPCRRFGTE
ncbi:hypothetical protein JG688_00011482 [Phytophthora aleatoria]|uniref:Uncharacterized protein n=1 Tax=Phytophthora aleatoria TaxID=2496075 RepID=A0A8J5M2P7_9STRA|nr:hypothetical protein JG688_00011482 [Phytophthora aleatoria]